MKPRGVVVEGCVPPRGSVVALLASLRELGLHVIGIGSALEVLKVTRHASRIGQMVIIVDVTGSARRFGVCTRQRKSRFRVIELRRNPGCRVMTGLTRLREALLGVIRIIGVLIILQVAGNARFYRQIEVSVHVALVALQTGVRACQWESNQIVIEVGWLPGGCGVALLTGLRHSDSSVVGVVGLLIIR